MALLLMPYTNLHELNLDWIIQNLKEAGVTSVNGETGIVVLYRDATVQLPDVPSDLNWKIIRNTNGAIEGIKFNKGAPMQRVHGNNEYLVYDAGNPPPYPVTSVNGYTGAVVVPVPLDNLAGEIVSFSQNAPGHVWALNRKTQDGDLYIELNSTGDNPTISLGYVNNAETVDKTLKLITEQDNPKGVFVDHESKMTYTIPMTDYTAGVYWMSLMYIQTGTSAPGLYMIFADATQVQVTKIAGDSVITFTGVKYDNNIVLTASDTVWGGIRAFTMN